MTGGALIGFLGFWQGVGHHVPSSVYWVIGVVGLFIAFYRAWLYEHNANQALAQGRKTDRKPEWSKLAQDKRRLEDQLAALEAQIPAVRIVPALKLGKDDRDLLLEKIERKRRSIKEIEERMKIQ